MSSHKAQRRHVLGATAILGVLGLVGATQAEAAGPGLVTTRSAYSVADTIARFNAAVTEAGWMVFTEIDHAAAAARVGMKLAPRTVVLFGNPRTGTPAMRAHPTLAIDLPMRVLAWQDDKGAVFVTRNTGRYVAETVFARHGIHVDAKGAAAMDGFFAKLVAAATA